MSNELTNILTQVGDLQSRLVSTPGSNDVMAGLGEIRKAALNMLQNRGADDYPLAACRKEVVDQVDVLEGMIGCQNRKNIPDSRLFEIAAAADTLTTKTTRYIKLRNQAAFYRAVIPNFAGEEQPVCSMDLISPPTSKELDNASKEAA